METIVGYHPVTVSQALVRDGYRCCLSGCYDYESARAWPAVNAMAKETQSKLVETECCHIFSEGTLQSVSKGEGQARGAGFISRANIDHPTEGRRCYCVGNFGNLRTSTLGRPLEWERCTFVGEYHHYGYGASSEVQIPRAVVGTTNCHLGQKYLIAVGWI